MSRKQSTMNTDIIIERPLGDIAPDPDQPRKKFDLEPILATFGDSPRIWEPITIRATRPGEKNTNGSPRTEPFTIIEGEQRYRAAKQVGMSTIPTLPPIELDGDALVLRQIASSSTKTPLLPLEVADAVARLKNKKKPAEIAKQCGFSSVKRVHQALALASLSQDIRDKLSSGDISEPVARSIGTIADPALQKQCLAEVLKNDIGHNKTRTSHHIASKYQLSLDPESAGFDTTDASLPGGPCGRCPKNTASQRSLGIIGDEQTDTRCVDKACFEKKRAATWTRAKASYTERGIRVIEGEAATRLFPYATTIAPTDSTLVSLKELVCMGLNDNPTTYAALLGVVDPSSVAYAHGNIYEMVDRTRLVSLLRAKGLTELAESEQEFLDEIASDKTDHASISSEHNEPTPLKTILSAPHNTEQYARVREAIDGRVKHTGKVVWRGICTILVTMRPKHSLDMFCLARELPANTLGAIMWVDDAERTEIELARAVVELLIGADRDLLDAMPLPQTCIPDDLDTIVAFMRGNDRTRTSREDLDNEDIVAAEALDAHMDALVAAGRVVVVAPDLWKLSQSEIDSKRRKRGR